MLRYNPEEVFIFQNSPDLGPFFRQPKNIEVNIRNQLIVHLRLNLGFEKKYREKKIANIHAERYEKLNGKKRILKAHLRCR